MSRPFLVNNQFYNQLSDSDWYERDDHPVALLRSEAKVRNEWLIEQLKYLNVPLGAQVLDIGCGAGFLSHELVAAGYAVTGVDSAEEALEIARKRSSSKATFIQADASLLPFPQATFDVVCVMDLLEHVADPTAVILESGRVLKHGGHLFFHTFNRNPLSWLFAAKGLEWVLKNCPKNLHRYEQFIKPSEMRRMLSLAGFELMTLQGLRPRFIQKSWFPLLFRGVIPKDFTFVVGGRCTLGYLGIARTKTTNLE